MNFKVSTALALLMTVSSPAYAVPDSCDAYGRLSGEQDILAADLSIAGLGSRTYSGVASAAADVDGDGIADLLIGAPGAALNGRDSGAVYIFIGPLDPDGPIDLGQANVVIAGGGFEENSGVAISSVGDLDGDGADEILIGTESNGSSATPQGVAYLVYGSADLGGAITSVSLASASPPVPVAKFVGETNGDGFGRAVAPAVDFNQDGQLDVVIGAPSSNTGGIDYGAAYVWLSPPSSGTIPATSADIVFTGNAPGSGFGSSFAAADIDGVGGVTPDDLFIGAPTSSDPESDVGEVLGFVGSATRTAGQTLDRDDADYRVVGRRKHQLGTAITNGGDVDLDGLDDIWIGAPYENSDSRGAVYLMRASDLRPGTLIAEFDASTKLVGVSNSLAGFRLSGGGDLNADGAPDLVVGAFTAPSSTNIRAGRAWLVTTPVGTRTRLDQFEFSATGAEYRDFAGYSVVGNADFNDDGFDDLVVGALNSSSGGTGYQAGMTAVFFGGEDVADEVSWYEDADSDGYGAGTAVVSCTQPVGANPYVAVSGDCAPGDPNIHPGATETCGLGVDMNCDGSVDGADVDGDGYTACNDCNDNNGLQNPSRGEVCGNLIDDNCDGLIDDPSAIDAVPYYPDADRDGYGDRDAEVITCGLPASLAGNPIVTTGGDCDDANYLINPGQPEYCDSVDNDCANGIDDDGSVDAQRWYADVDGDSYGSNLLASSVRACSQPTIGGVVYQANRDDCDDSFATIRPGATETCDYRDNDCDGINYIGGTIFSDIDEHYTVGGSTADVRLGGGEMASLGDLDFDGDHELAITEIYNSTYASNAGAVYIVNGKYDADEVQLQKDATGVAPWRTRIFGTRLEGYFGTRVRVGDLNGDARADLIISAPGARVPQRAQGAVYVFYGPIRQGELLADDADLILAGENEADQFGGGLDIGDLDGDGYDDIVAGATEWRNDGSPDGRVYVFYGKPNWTGTLSAGTADAIHDGGKNERMGRAIAIAEDLDGDGNKDFIASSPVMADLIAARVSFFYGTGARWSGELTADASASYPANGRWGNDIDVLGDVDGDGRTDFLVGGALAASVDLVFGERYSGAFNASNFTRFRITGSIGGSAYLGDTVEALGDINHDGTPDFIFGAQNASVAYLVYGDPTMRARAEDPSLATISVTYLQGFGAVEDGTTFPTYSYKNLRDLDGNVIGVQGARIGTNNDDGLGSSLAAVDFDGDGSMDVALGAWRAQDELGNPWAGRVRVLLAGSYGTDAVSRTDGGLADDGDVLIREIYEGSGFRKYVALYNAGTSTVSLDGWKLNIYSNGSATPSATPLDGVSLLAGANYIVMNPDAAAVSWFSSTFGRAPDGTSPDISHTGNDAYGLENASGTVIDVYGAIGVDGTGQPWEGVDAIWTRAVSIYQATNTWTASQWSKNTNLATADPFGGTATAGVSYEVVGHDSVINYLDIDADGFGDQSGAFVLRCDMHLPINFSNPANPKPATTLDDTVLTDCDDYNASVYPGAPESDGDAVDSNCDGLLDSAKPPVVEAVISPAAPTSRDTLEAHIELYDEDTNLSSVSVSYTWFLGTSPDESTWVEIAGESGNTLSPGNFTAGDYVGLEVVANDGVSDSAPYTAHVVVSNSRPYFGEVAGQDKCEIAPRDPTMLDTITATGVGLTDPDAGDVPYIVYEWWVYEHGTLNDRRDPRGDEDNALGSGQPAWGATRPSCVDANFPPGDVNESLNCKRDSEMYARCIAYDAAGRGEVAQSDKITVINAPPVMDTCTLSPVNPRTSDNLTVSATAHDPDVGDTVTISYTFLEDGVAIPGYASVAVTTLPHTEVEFGHQYSVRCTPRDNFNKIGQAVTSSPALSVANTAPTQPSFFRNPLGDPRSDASISVILGTPASDPDVNEGTQTLSYEVRWTNLTTGTVFNNPNPWSTNGATSGTLGTLPFSATAKNQQWRVEVRATDGYSYSAITVDEFQIRNTPPSFSTAAISPDDGGVSTPTTTHDLAIVTTGWTDYDGDVERYKVLWYRNDVLQATTSPETLFPRANTTRGDEFYAIVTAFDGTDDGNTITTSTVTILNSVPSQPAVSLLVWSDGTGPAVAPPPDTVDDIICNLDTSSTDADTGDTVSYTIQWFEDSSATPIYVVNKTPAPTGTSDADWHLPADQTSYGDRIKCRVTPYDNFGSGAAGTFAETPYVEVQDLTQPNAPVFDSIARYGNSTTVTLSGTCVAGQFDCSVLTISCTSPTATNLNTTATCTGLNDFSKDVFLDRGHTWTCGGICTDQATNDSPPSGTVVTEICDPFDSYEINASEGPTYGDSSGNPVDEFAGLPDDNASSITVTGNIIGADTVDWYRFQSTDNVSEDLADGRDAYNFQITMQAGIDDYDITVYRGTNPSLNPSAVPECNATGQYDDYNWYNWDKNRRANGTSVSDRPLPADRQACGANPNAAYNYCADDSVDYYVQVVRTQQTDCQHYRLRASNGGTNTP